MVSFEARKGNWLMQAQTTIEDALAHLLKYGVLWTNTADDGNTVTSQIRDELLDQKLAGYAHWNKVGKFGRLALTEKGRRAAKQLK